MMVPRPLGVLAWLLRRVSSRDAAAAAIGDILEEFSERRRAGRAPRWSAAWVNLQTLRAVVTAMLAGAPRQVRSAGLLLRDAVRALRAAPASSGFIVLVLAVGITAGTVTFSVVDAVVFKPLPVDHPEQLVTIATREPDFAARITTEVYWRLHDSLTSIEAMATRTTLYGSQSTIGGVTDERAITYTNAEIFTMLGWSPAIGRFWTPDEEARDEKDVAVLGYRIWRDLFHGDPAVLGATVAFGDRTLRVIGVLPAESDRPELDLTNTPIWIPTSATSTPEYVQHSIIARMHPGVTPAQVAAEIKRVSGVAGWEPDVAPLRDMYVASFRRWMLLALGAAAMVILIACVNAANLMLTRSSRRGHELAIRASLGATRRQIAGALLAEGFLLSAAATACALLLSIAGVRLAKFAVTTMLLGVFRASTIALNGRVLATAIGAAVVTGLLVSIVPAWQTSRAPVTSLLKDAEGATAAGRWRWRSVFLTAEVASVVTLLVVSWLFVVSLIRVARTDLVIDRTNVAAIKSRLRFQGTLDEIEQRTRSLPGVSDVAVSAGGASLPLIGRAYSGVWVTTTVERAEGSSGALADAPLEVLQYQVTPNYFDVAGLPFTRGRTWQAGADAGEAAVVMDERAARELFGSTDAVGHRLRAARPEGVYTVIGVVPYLHARGPEEDSPPAVYFTLKRDPARNLGGLFVRTTGPARDMVPILTDALQSFAPPTKDPFVLLPEDAVRHITATRRFNGGLMAAFGLVGVLIAAAGVYAVMASFVVQQTHEIGVRVALGATPGHIQRGVIWMAWRHLAVGLALGLPVAWWLSRGFASLLFQVTPADASVYVGVSAMLVAIGVLAAWVPSRRAARIDPIVTLRR